MAHSESDTLDINMIAPGHSTKEPQPEPITHKAPHPENDPEAAALARAKIAELVGEPAAAAAHQTPTAPIAPAPAETHIPAPVAPAHTKSSTTPAKPKHHKKPGAIHRLKEHPAKPIFTALASFLLIITLFKSPVLFNQISYLVAKPAAQEPIATQPVTTATNATPTILIPKVNVNAPIVFESSLDEAKIDHALESGVVHYGSTPMPGQPGNSVIVGHSSNDWWQPGNYKFVFVLLDKLIIGDNLSIDYQGTRYIYEVTEARVVEATDLSVLNPTPVPSITLITCWPTGTNLKRWIIRAKQISPKVAPTTIPTTDQAPDTKLLPGSAPDFLNQVKDFWSTLSSTISNKPTEVEAPVVSPAANSNSPSQGVQTLPGAK